MFKYRLKKLSKRKLVVWSTLIFISLISLFSMTSYFAIASFDGGSSSNIIGDTLVVNDLTADWNYYESLNYTQFTSKTVLPTETNRYNQNTLAAVQINYDGHDVNDDSLVGAISATENQTKLVYYKYYPIEDNKVRIELIDNPFTKRPNNKGFNGWVCDDSSSATVSCDEMVFEYDDDYYLRYVTIPAPAASGNGDKKAIINLKASWFDANIIGSCGRSCEDANNSFNDKGMVSAVGKYYKQEPIWECNYSFIDGVNYYIVMHYKKNQQMNGYSVTGGVEHWVSEQCKNNNGCDLYTLVEGADKTYYNPNETYYVAEWPDTGGAVFSFAVPGDFGGGCAITGYRDVYVDDRVLLKDNDLATGYFYKMSNFNINATGVDKSLYYNTRGENCSEVSCFGDIYKLIQYGETIKNSYTLQGDEEFVSSTSCETTIDRWKTCEVQTPKRDDKNNIMYDENGEIVYDIKVVTANDNSKYYYLVTRDMNIINLTTGNVPFANLNSLTKPFTITSSYNGPRTNSYITASSTGSFTAAADLVIENIRVDGPSVSTSNSRSNYNNIYANYKNIKIGRNVIDVDGMVAYGVIGGAGGRGGASIDGNKVIVESGHYNYLRASSTSSGTNEHTIMQYGSDYDRVSLNNDNLLVEFQALASDSGNHNSSTIIPSAETIVKSGTFGNYMINGRGTTGTDSYYTYGIYAGGISGGSSTSLRTLKVEGGRVFSINGGPCVSSNAGNAIGIYMTGGEVDNIVGGAGTSETYGNRVVSISGGTVNNSVAGGSNSYSGSSNSGPLSAQTLVYIGGDAVLGGTPAKTENNGSLYAIERKGSVFGAGLGARGSTTRGVVNTSKVIINGGTIDGDVYGGGNYGAAGTNSGYSGTITTDVIVKDGVVNGSVFGGSNSNGFARNNSRGTLKISMSGGKINYLYGGSNSTGTIYSDIDMDITGGTIINEAFGGGYGNGTNVNGSILIDTKTSEDAELVIGSLYGGSANGSVNVDRGNYTTTVNIDGGTIGDAVYGAGKGESNAPNTYGNITVNVKNGIINNVFGGNNIRGTLTHDGNRLQVNVSGGKINTVYGGSKGAQAGANVTNVNVTGGKIYKALYGGGMEAPTTTSNVNVSGGSFATLDDDGYAVADKASIFGGGFKATVSTTNVNILNGATAYEVYGGSNESGVVTTSNVNNNGGNILCNAYGGGNIASVRTANNNLNGTKFVYKMKETENVYNTQCGNAFGGGASADVTTSNITLKGSSLINVYGGSNKAGTVNRTNVNINSGDVKSVFGGNNEGGTTGDSRVIVSENNGTLKVLNVFGGSNGSAASISNSTLTELRKGTVTEDIFGGGNQAKVLNSTEVNIYGGKVRNVYGGGNRSFIGNAVADSLGAFVSGTDEGSTEVNVVSGEISKNVYGSGNASFVYGSTKVNVGYSALKELNLVNDNTINKNISIDGSIFGGSETNTSEDITFDFSFKGVIGTADIYLDGTNYLNNDKSTIVFDGSIYGSGNNSATDGISKIYVNNYGTLSNPVTFTSLQRATYAFVNDSYIELNGDRDRADPDSYRYSLIRLDNLYVLGSQSNGTELSGSQLYLRRGSSTLKKIFSGTMNNGVYSADSFIPQTTTENNGRLVNAISDNRIYMLTNVVLSIANGSEPSYDATTSNAGPVKGMAFLGMYTHETGKNYVRGIYDYGYSQNSDYDSSVTGIIPEQAYTFVYGLHEFPAETQIRTNGYYTNVLDEETNKINVEYVPVTPLDAPYYKWVIGEEPTDLVVDLEADKYSENGTTNKIIALDDLREIIDGKSYEWRDAVMTIKSVDTSNFGATAADATQAFDGVLVDKSEVLTINTNDLNGDGVVDANNYFALSMGTTSSGWMDNYKTNFYDADYADVDLNFCSEGNGDCTLDSKYTYDSTRKQRALSFWLYHSKNLDFSYIDKSIDPSNTIIPMGQIYIYVEFRNPHGDPTLATSTKQVRIVVNVSLTDGEMDTYGAMIAPGKKYEVFQARPTSIASDGAFSIYQSLALDLTKPMASSKEGELWSVDKLYNKEKMVDVKDPVTGAINTVKWGEAYRYLASSYVFPVGTKITMLDLKNNEQYYYDVTSDLYNKKQTEMSNGKVKYYLKDFIKMGSTDNTNLFDNDMNEENSTKYYYHDENIELAVEEFIFTVDFSGVADKDQASTIMNPYLYLQLSRMVGEGINQNESTIIAPKGNPEQDMAYTIYPDVHSEITTTGGFLEKDGTLSDSTTIYVGESTELNLETSLIQKDSAGNILNNVSDTIYDDYKLGAMITIMRTKLDSDGNEIIENGQPVYEKITQDLFGTIISINGEEYYPQTDGTIRIELAGRITDVLSSINIDLSNSSLDHRKYKLVVETFATYDGLYYGDFTPTHNEYDFELLSNQYGLDVLVPPVSVTHDVNTGLDKNGIKDIQYTVSTKNGLADPNLKISLQRRIYNNAYDTIYEDVDLKDIATDLYVDDSATNMLNSCYNVLDNGKCQYYNLGNIGRDLEGNTYEVYLTLKAGPDKTDLADKSNAKWKSGTYRVVFTMYDGDTPVGSVYEYLIIRSLNVDEEIEGS